MLELLFEHIVQTMVWTNCANNWFEQIVQTNITIPKVDSLEKIPLFVTRLDTRVLTIIDPQMPDGNIDIGTITVNIGHFIVDETL